jgi:peptidoglycan hydrolase-like protein with peptidoglycan-binding domain
MFTLNRPVGKMSSNKTEDVALVQAALKQIRGSNGRPLWPGPIDGKTGTRDIESLSAAIAGFESKANLRITGTMPNSGNVFNAVGRALPTNYKDMHGIPGTNIVAGHVARKRPKPDGGVGELPLPESLAAALLRLMGRLEKALNYLPTVQMGPVDANGRCEIAVELGLRFLDAGGRIPGKTAPMPAAIKSLVDGALGGSQYFSFSGAQGAQLTLLSRDPLCFPPAQLAGGSAAWPLFSGSVGKGGGNAIHDVAVLQAALINIQAIKTNAPFWSGGIDGKASNDLNDALATLQRAADLPATGTVKPGDATVKALSALLPSSFKGLRGVPGLAVAKVGDELGRSDVGLASLSESIRWVLAPLDEATRTRHGVGLVLREKPRPVFARVHVTVTLGGGAYLDAHGRILPDLEAPPVVREAVKALIASDKRLSLDANGPPGRIVLALAGRSDEGERIDIEYDEKLFYIVDVIEWYKGWHRTFDANHMSSDMAALAVDDAAKIAQLTHELGPGAKATLDYADGRPMMLIKGGSGVREVLIKSAYMARDPRMIQFAVGNFGRVVANFKSIAYVGVVVLVADSLAQAFLKQKPVEDAVTEFMIDGAKMLVAATIAEGIALGFAQVGMLAVLGPFVIAAGVAFVASLGLNYLDDEYKITEKIIAYLKSLERSGPTPGLPHYLPSDL